MTNEKQPLLQVKDLEIVYGRGRSAYKAVKGISFDIYEGETFGVVGESGSGKTTVGRAIMRIIKASKGNILYKGKNIAGKLSLAEEKQLTQEIQMIFQDPMSSLNERAKVDYIVSEGIYRKDITKEERQQKVQQALKEVGLRPEFASRFPHEFSGGQRQRIGIARAMIMEPSFIVADEPISALDVSIRAQVLNLMAKLQREKNLTYLFISHDLSVMRFICDRVAALYKGRIVELADTETLYKRPLHPYTQSLLSSIPQPNPKKERAKVIKHYDAEQAHDYTTDKPYWCEIEPGHFVWANDTEIEAYKVRLQELDEIEKR